MQEQGLVMGDKARKPRQLNKHARFRKFPLPHSIPYFLLKNSHPQIPAFTTTSQIFNEKPSKASVLFFSLFVTVFEKQLRETTFILVNTMKNDEFRKYLKLWI